jgi:predicted secreted protein
MMAIEEEVEVLYKGRIRNKLNARGYYVDDLGAIMEEKDSKYILGYISRVPREFLWKKTVVMATNVGSVINGVYYPNANAEKSNFWQVLRAERIPNIFLDVQN